MLHFYKENEKDTVMLEMGNPREDYSGDAFTLLNPNTTDAAAEKHVPVVSVEDGLVVVRVGSAPHPMTPEHYIEWIFIKTSAGGIYCNLNPEDPPEAKFPIVPDEVESVYAYCNLHGLWKAMEPVLPNAFETNDVACSAEFTEGCVDPSGE